MIGDRLHRIARRVLRAETCRTIVEPAVADLQYEAGHGRWAAVRGYAAVWRTIVAAAAGELAADCHAVLAATSLRPSLGPLLLALGVGGVVFAPRLWNIYGHSNRPWHHDAVLFLLMAPGLFAALAPALTPPVTATLARTGTPGSVRAALLLSVLTGTIVVGSAQAAQWQLDLLWLDAFYTSTTSVRAGNQDRPLWELRRRVAEQREALAVSDPRVRERWALERGTLKVTPIDRHRLAAAIVLVVPFALLGLTWARRSRWTVALLSAAAFMGVVMLQVVANRVLYSPRMTAIIAATWTPVAILLPTASAYWYIRRAG